MAGAALDWWAVDADPALAALALPPGYHALAEKMAEPVRDLVVHNKDPAGVSVDDVLGGLGLPAVQQSSPAQYAGLKSLALLSLLPKSTGAEAEVLHVDSALEPVACEACRKAVDAASFSAADSVDGCTDFQLNCTRKELEEFVGKRRVAQLWSVANKALRHFRGEEDWPSDEEELEEEEGSEEQLDKPESNPSLLDAHEIFIRRYTPDTRPWFPFHRDRSELTINIALSDDAQHGGGRLLCLLDGAVRRVERSEGGATVHPSSLMHAVSRMTHGARYSLIIFLGRNERIKIFNQEVGKLAKHREVGSAGDESPLQPAQRGEEVSRLQHRLSGVEVM